MENCLIIANKNHEAIAEIIDYEFECAFGADENKITLTVDPSVNVPVEGYVFIDGSAYGGTIDEVKSDSDGLSLSVTGRSWQGILAGKRLLPDSGKAKLSVSGSVAAVLRRLITRMDLDDVFSAPDNESDNVSISNYSFERFIDGYSGICAMLKASSLKLTVKHKKDKVLIGARPVVDYANTVDSDLMGFKTTRIARRTNHLVCGGTGEEENRAIVHFYADKNGKVSKKQSLFGVDEIEAFYDYSNADESKLEEDGKKKLEEMQGEGTVETSVDEDIDIDIGDIVSAKENNTGIRVSAEITKKILKISGGIASFEYEAGTASEGTSNSTISGSGESSNGGHSYYAGKGITINNYTINADVDSADLDIARNRADSAYALASNASAAAGRAQETADGKADKSHTHPYLPLTGGTVTDAIYVNGANGAACIGVYEDRAGDDIIRADIVSVHGVTRFRRLNSTNLKFENYLDLAADGTTLGKPLAVDSGGTGASSAKAARYNLFADAGFEAPIISDNHPIVMSYLTPSTANGSVYNLRAGRFWDYIKTKASSVFAAINHMHLYAGSKTAGGAANSADKLTTARMITIEGAVNGSAEFDGAKDITLTVTGDSEAASFLAAHPVGAIYLTTSPTDPGTTYGGTWAALPYLNGFAWERTA